MKLSDFLAGWRAWYDRTWGRTCPGALDLVKDDWTMEGLQTFLATDGLNMTLWVPEVHDCDDFAGELRDRALLAGKYLSIITIWPDEWQRLYGVPFDARFDYHVMNMARVGNQYWYIEPQTDQMWLAHERIDAGAAGNP